MKKVIVVVTLCLFFLGCQPKVEKESVTLLNGYWEIEKVVFEQGKDKEYSTNDSFDYFEIKGDTGFRKKVMPQLDGTFQANDLVETIRVREKNDQIFLEFKTDFTQWSEELVSITAKELVLRNDEQREYHYKKTGPIKIIDNGKKTE
ncbi:lipocalin family protein [Flavobacterium sp. TSSA_36]|uniref:lipocalin family protein n=1 Tax=Flavobacterium sp. TSSA_36 TaxID=3447669 RepID=UPI003F3A569A